MGALRRPLSPETVDSLTLVPVSQLHDLAWWIATEAAQYAGLSTDPDVSASIAERALTANAHRRAQTSQLSNGEHRWLWLTLHRATNPDPVAAVDGALDAARYAAGPHAVELLDAARQRIAALGSH